MDFVMIHDGTYFSPSPPQKMLWFEFPFHLTDLSWCLKVSLPVWESWMLNCSLVSWLNEFLLGDVDGSSNPGASKKDLGNDFWLTKK